MKLSDLRLLLKHAPDLAGVQVNHPDNCTRQKRLDLWFLVRWSATEEKFGAAR